MTTTSTASRTFAWLRQFAKLWGFALFCVFVVYIFREVVLPFLFAILVAYILAPLVARASNVRIGARPFPRGAAVIILGPGVRQIQPIRHRQARTAIGKRQRHRHLAVRLLAKLPAILV